MTATRRAPGGQAWARAPGGNLVCRASVHSPTVELSGPWQIHAADDELRRSARHRDFDDREWLTTTVPHHWRDLPELAGGDGPYLYRHRFDTTPLAGDRRLWLTFEGLFYQGDVYLDGEYLGDTEGYFAPHSFDISNAARSSAEHVLAVELTCSPQRNRTAKTNLTGVFQHWDCLDPQWNPGGIWRPVRLSESGPVRISSLRLVCLEANDEGAVVLISAELDSTIATSVIVRSTVGGAEHQIAHRLTTGTNSLSWRVIVDRPTLWWPRALGDPHLVDATVGVWLGDRSPDSVPSDQRSLRTGLRQVRMKNWIVSVNGEQLFLKGANQGPTRMALAHATENECERDVQLALDAGLDLLRIHGHITLPATYDAADRAGLLLWQDMPLQWGYARGVRKQAARQATAAVDLLGHHPSIAIWCGHNEPFALDIQPGKIDVAKAAKAFVIGHELPGWNKTVLDRSIKSALTRADPTRPVIAHSGVLPHPGSLGTDAHLYFGWYHGNERDLPNFVARVPRLASFVTEFGAQAIPNSDGFMDPQRWPDLDWDRLQTRHSLQKDLLDERVPRDSATSFADWRDATQRYQADVIRYHVETLRRLKYRPAGGFAMFAFADAYPAVTWCVLDHQRVPKQAFAALRDACQPVIVVADRPAATYSPGDPIALDVHVVSDLRQPLRDCVVTAEATWPGGSHTWRYEGAVGADSCERIGTLALLCPEPGASQKRAGTGDDSAPEPAELELRLTLTRGDSVVATNSYRSVIRSRASA